MQRARRLLALQQQLHRIERWRLLDLEHKSAELDRERRELIAALNQDDALQGLFLDATARRLLSLAQQADEIAREEAAQQARVAEQAVLVACSERLAETEEETARHASERKALEDVIERAVGAATQASRKIAER